MIGRFLVVLTCGVQIVAATPSLHSGDYNIWDPPETNPVQQYSGDFSANGESDDSGETLTVKVRLVGTNDIRLSVNTTSYAGTESDGEWQVDLDEPSPSWAPGGSVDFESARVELWHMGMKEDSVLIKVQ